MTRDWTAAHEKVQDEAACRWCGARDALDSAHIIPRSRGGDMSADNIVTLCRTHHALYDAGRLELLGCLSRAEQTHAVSLVGVAEAYRRTTTELV